MSVLGIDLGSGSCKGVVFAHDGTLLAQAARAYAPSCPRPGWAEMAADTFWDSLVAVTREVAAQVAHDPIDALAISSHGETVIPVDQQGQAVGPALMNSDNRATAEAAWWTTAFGDEAIYRITGSPLHAMFALNKILWLRHHAPEGFARTDRFLSVGDYLLLQMGFPPYTDPSLASRTMAFDIHRRAWSADILACAGIGEERLGIVRPSGEPVGRLSRATAELLGLPIGTLVAMGGHDQPCGALGAGGTQAGQVVDSAGTYECLAAVSDAPGNTPQARTAALNSYCHVVAGKYVTLAFFPAGLAVRWFVEQFCYQDLVEARAANWSLYEALDASTARLGDAPTGLCVTPHLVGSCTPNWDVRATGVIAGITPGITRHHLYKAIYEGLACELALNIEAVEAVMGPLGRIRIYGGNARSPFTVQLRADLTGHPFELLATPEAVCQGAAILAGLAAGLYATPDEAATRFAAIARTVAPNPVSTKQYARQLGQYRLLYPALTELRGFAPSVH
jgi:xylulokinase